MPRTGNSSTLKQSYRRTFITANHMEREQQQGIIKRHIPWWLYLSIAILSYSLLKYVLPMLASDQASREKFIESGSQAAPILAIIFLLLAANALYKNVPKDKGDTQDEQKEDTP